jgi:hypothetical protein
MTWPSGLTCAFRPRRRRRHATTDLLCCCGSAARYWPAEGEWCAAALTSSRPHFEPDADLSGIIFGEMNASLLESFLYFDDSRELSFLNAFVSFNALQGRQA